MDVVLYNLNSNIILNFWTKNHDVIVIFSPKVIIYVD
jgi:hypothetical protein